MAQENTDPFRIKQWLPHLGVSLRRARKRQLMRTHLWRPTSPRCDKWYVLINIEHVLSKWYETFWDKPKNKIIQTESQSKQHYST